MRRNQTVISFLKNSQKHTKLKSLDDELRRSSQIRVSQSSSIRRRKKRFFRNPCDKELSHFRENLTNFKFQKKENKFSTYHKEYSSRCHRRKTFFSPKTFTLLSSLCQSFLKKTFRVLCSLSFSSFTSPKFFIHFLFSSSFFSFSRFFIIRFLRPRRYTRSFSSLSHFVFTL